MGNIWGIHQLIPHPDTPPRNIECVRAQILSVDAQSMMIEYHVRPASMVMMPPEVAHVRTDGLWRTTCFEAFLKSSGSDEYQELNFSPSFAWAAYGFDDYRGGMRNIPFESDPEIITSLPGEDHYFLSAEFDRPCFGVGKTLLGLSAVIEETDGTKSYWALRHPPGKPDFHHPDCFALELPAPERS